MRKHFTEQLGKAAYEARHKALITGAYPKSAIEGPHQRLIEDWDVADERLDPIKDLYRKEGEAAANAFIAFVALSKNKVAFQALETIIQELKQEMFTDIEIAKMESD